MKKFFKLLLAALFLLSTQIKVFADSETEAKLTISGYIKDASNGEALIGATVLVKEEGKGTAANIYGFYSLSLKPGNYTLVYSFIGYNSQEKTVNLTENLTINVELNLESQVLEEVVVSSEKPNSNVTKPQMSVTRLEMKSIQRIPALMGEVDIIKAIQMLPGVQATAEGSSGFSVRGGSSDQNLIQLDEATVYNASHVMGFFSVFNNDAIKDLKLYKGDIPASSGGRLSSLLDVRMKDGNSKKFEGTGGIGTISGRFTVEGPIIKDTSSFIVSGRRSWIDLFFPLFKNQEIKDSKLYFYDLNAKVNYTINENNRIYLSGYFGRDVYKIVSSEFAYGNQTLTLRWNHLFSKSLFLNTTLIYSNYNYLLGSDFDDASAFKWTSEMNDYSLRFNFNYFLNQNNNIQFGVQSTYHKFSPGLVEGTSAQSMINRFKLNNNYAFEHGIYALNEQLIGTKLTLKYGARLSIFQNIGRARVFKYDQSYEVVDTTYFDKGEIFNTYVRFEPRLGLSYAFNSANSVKISYSRTYQYVQQASNSQGGTPFDVWYPASPNVKPQKSDMYVAGYFKNFMENTIETSAEVYYKTIDDVIDFKEHANPFLNEKLEGELRVGNGRAYGLELMAKINRKKFGGWVSYTYARAFRTIPTIEKNHEFNAPYDKPHSATVVLSYDFNKRVTLSANWIYSTGQPLTAPTKRMEIDGNIVPVYSERNGMRYPDYHRLDLSLTVKTKKSFTRRWKGEWNFSIYNVYNRKNAWVINFVQDKKDSKKTYAEKTYLLPIIPSISYNFKF